MDKRIKEFFSLCRQGDVLDVKEAVERGMDPHVMGDYALVEAATGGRLATVQFLLECGLDPNNSTALIRAYLHGHVEVMKYLIVAGADKFVLTYKSISAAAASGHLNVIKYMVEELGVDARGGEESPLRHAVNENQPDITQYLLTRMSADVHFDEDYAVKQATKKGYAKVLSHLVHAGADVNTNEGEPIATAVRNDDLDCARILIEQGEADVGINENGPLRIAVEKENLEMVKLLVLKGNADASVYTKAQLKKIEDKKLRQFLESNRKKSK